MATRRHNCTPVAAIYFNPRHYAVATPHEIEVNLFKGDFNPRHYAVATARTKSNGMQNGFQSTPLRSGDQSCTGNQPQARNFNPRHYAVATTTTTNKTTTNTKFQSTPLRSGDVAPPSIMAGGMYFNPRHYAVATLLSGDKLSILFDFNPRHYAVATT